MAPTAAAIRAAIRTLLDERGPATACPSEVARRLAPRAWRPLMPAVREVAARMQARGQLDAYQRGRPVEVATAKGPIRLRAKLAEIDYRAHPERYVIGRGEQGVLSVQPYARELVALWRFATPAAARTSARALYAAFVAFGRAGDFVGMDMARKFIQMGWTRARRYANHPSGRKYTANRKLRPIAADHLDSAKAESAAIFFAAYERARGNRRYAQLRAAWQAEVAAGATPAPAVRRPRSRTARSARPSRGGTRAAPRSARGRRPAPGTRRARRCGGGCARRSPSSGRPR